MDHIDIKFINLVGSRLQKFKQIKNNLFNFRCPICGDSQKNKTKARGYIYQVKNNANYKCHNCGLNISFSNFLKKVDSNLHKQYTFEKFKYNKTGKNFTAEEPKFNFESPKFNQKINLPKASENENSNDYLLKRKINPEKFFYAEKFKEWTNTQIKKFNSNDLKYDEPRIIIPLYYKKNLIGFQGRSINHSPIKYITIMLDDESPKIYGYDLIDLNEKVYVVEGPFDSTFVKNSLAMCGADVNLANLNISHPVYVYDNEPRNKEIHLRMMKRIEEGCSIVIWPSSIKEKDINDMILSGLDVQSVIESNTYSGLEAKLKFTNWKKYEQRNQSS
jgi:transcription elongation factor Elf1